MVKTRRVTTPALGMVCGMAANPKISVTLDPDTFAELSRIAVKNSASMGLTIRTMVGRGLMAEKTEARK